MKKMVLAISLTTVLLASVAIGAWANTIVSDSAVVKVKGKRARIIGGYGDNFDWSGSTTQYTRGKAKGWFKDETDTGYLNAWVYVPEGVYPEGAGIYRIVAKNWVGTMDWMDGGIASYLTLHGASGRGPPVLPEVFSYIAGWGTADVYIYEFDGDDDDDDDGNLLYEDLEFHFMITNGARDLITHAVYNSDQTGFYSPADPGNAFIYRYDRVLHVVAHSEVPDPGNFPPWSVFFHWNFEDVTFNMKG